MSPDLGDLFLRRCKEGQILFHSLFQVLPKKCSFGSPGGPTLNLWGTERDRKGPKREPGTREEDGTKVG